MKLLMESWRKYLNEGEETHFPWLEDLKQRGKEALMGDNFEKIGSGAFRIVFQPKGDEDHVVKLSKESGNNWMNKVEMKTGNFYPSIFPKTFAHADDWGWIVQEAVNVLTPKNQEAHLGDVLYKTFPEISVDFGSREELSEPIELWDLIKRALSNPVSSDEIELQAYGLENEKAFRELSSAVARFKIDPEDLKMGNIGFDKDNFLKILDASVFFRIE